MADTIITNSPARRDSEEGAGWVVAVILLIAVVFGGIMLYSDGFFGTAAPADETTEINVSIPNPVTTPSEGGEGDAQ